MRITNDVCVIGSGPSGMAVALDLADRGHEVIVVEAGGLEPALQPEGSRAESHDAPWHAPLERVACQALGGNLALWSGRCVPLDRRDLEGPMPPSVGGARWPLDFEEIDALTPRAAAFLGCGDRFCTPPLSEFAASREIDDTGLEQWTPTEALKGRLRQTLLNHPQITVLTNATALGFERSLAAGVDGARQISGLRVRHGGEETIVTAREFVLAAGGVETTRLLLVEQQQEPCLFGGEDGPLGRYYMGHLTGIIARVRPKSSGLRKALDFFRPSGNAVARRRFTIDPVLAAAQDLCNIAFWVENLPREDPTHGSALRSLRFLGSAEGMRRLKDRTLVAAHARNLTQDFRNSLGLGARMAVRRATLPHLNLGQVIPTRGGWYALRYHAEHFPDPDNRITLGDTYDANGVPRVRIRFRYSEADVAAILRSHDVLQRAFQQSGAMEMAWLDERCVLADAIRRQACDGFHQIGSTRMSDDPRDGVVDRHLQVHGFANLHVASSSVFPTSGQCNPTLPLVALSLRLADRLHARFTGERPVGRRLGHGDRRAFSGLAARGRAAAVGELSQESR